MKEDKSGLEALSIFLLVTVVVIVMAYIGII